MLTMFWRSLKLVNMHQVPNSRHMHSDPKVPSLEHTRPLGTAELDKHPWTCHVKLQTPARSQYHGDCHLSRPSDASSHFEFGFSPRASGHLIPTSSTASVVGDWSVAKVQKEFRITILRALVSSSPAIFASDHGAHGRGDAGTLNQRN